MWDGISHRPAAGWVPTFVCQTHSCPGQNECGTQKQTCATLASPAMFPLEPAHVREVVKQRWAWISPPIFLGEKNVTGFSSRLLLVFLKNYMSSACLLYQIQPIENSQLHSMTDFNKIAITKSLSSGDRIFDTEERPAATNTQTNDCCIRWRCAIISHGDALGC